jgi:hypothetical protein
LPASKSLPHDCPTSDQQDDERHEAALTALIGLARSPVDQAEDQRVDPHCVELGIALDVLDGLGIHARGF